MNLLSRIFAVGALLTAAHSFAASSFEGKVTLAMTVDNKGRTQDMNYSMKGQKLRMDMNADGNQVSTIMDMDKLEMLMLMPDQKMYMTMAIKKPIEQAMDKADQSTMEVVVTGRTETILGYKCSEILMKDKGSVTEMWAAEGLGVFMGLNSGGAGGGGMFGGRKSANAAKWEEALKGKGGFPLRVITRDAKSKQTFKMEATKIEPGSLPDSLFVPPAGYKKFAMPSFGDMLKGGE